MRLQQFLFLSCWIVGTTTAQRGNGRPPTLAPTPAPTLPMPTAEPTTYSYDYSDFLVIEGEAPYSYSYSYDYLALPEGSRAPFISEYGEETSQGEGNIITYVKYIELYNPTNEELSLAGYGLAFTGNPTDGIYAYPTATHPGSTIPHPQIPERGKAPQFFRELTRQQISEEQGPMHRVVHFKVHFQVRRQLSQQHRNPGLRHIRDLSASSYGH